MQIVVKADRVNVVNRPAGATVVISNPGATDVFYDVDPGRLAASTAGVAGSQQGTKLAGGATPPNAVTIVNFPGQIALRASTDTTVEVLP